MSAPHAEAEFLELEEEKDFFAISSHWMSLEKEKRRLQERISKIIEEQDRMETAFPQISNLRGLTHAKVKINKKLNLPASSSSSSSIPQIPRPSSSTSPELFSALSTMTINAASAASKKRKSVTEEEKKERKEGKEEKKVEKTAPGKASKSSKQRERLRRKLLKDAQPKPASPMILNSQQANKSVAPEDKPISA